MPDNANRINHTKHESRYFRKSSRKRKKKKLTKRGETGKLHFLFISSIFPSSKHPSTESGKINAAARFQCSINNQKSDRKKDNNKNRAHLNFPALPFRFGSLSEIGNHSESPPGILDDRHGGSPSSSSFLRRSLRLNVKMLPQILLH